MWHGLLTYIYTYLKHKFIHTFIALFFCLLTHSQTQKAPQLTRILFVFDASKSMISKHENTNRIDGAKVLFNKFIDSLSKQKNYQFALRMYGHTVKYPPGDCKDSKLIVPFSVKSNVSLIKQKVAEAKPTGITPIEHSLTEAANDFPDAKARNMIILITDGIEECGGDPCEARQKLMQKGIVFKPFIIGIGLTPAQIKTFECVGTYFDFDDDKAFKNITELIQTQKLKKTSAQVNLLDSKGKPTETDVNMTFYDVNKKKYVYNYMHTLNKNGNPDTLYIDDFPTYKVIAHTIPPKESSEVKLTVGKHTTIPIEAPQGSMIITRPNGIFNFNEKMRYIVRYANQMPTLHVQSINTLEKYIVGTYDIEILTIPRIYLSGIKIEQSKLNEIVIPNAGMVQVKCIEAGDGAVFMKIGGRFERLLNLTAATLQTFYLQPGNYIIEWRSKTLKGSIYTIEKKFEVKPDQTTVVEMYK
jgi:Ca-activated chloride channel family protein